MKEYHLTGEPNDEDSWLTKAELDRQGYVIGQDTDAERTVGESGTSSTPTSQGQGQATSASGAGPEPEFWKYWSGGEAWPPKEQVKTGNKDKMGEDIYEQRPDFALIRKYQEWVRGETEKAEKAERERLKEEQSAQTAQAKAQQEQRKIEMDEALALSNADQQLQAPQPKRPSSLVGLMAEALDSGNIERARGLWDFENQVTPLQYLQLTLEYADNPEALKVLFDFVQARRPGIIGGQGQGPVSGQQAIPPTTAELQAQQAIRDALFKAQQSGIYQSQPAPDLGEGMFRSYAGTPYEVGQAMGQAQQQAQGGPFSASGQQPYYGPEIAMEETGGPFRGPSNFPGGEVDLPGDPSRQGPVARDATFSEFALTGPDPRETPEEKAARARGPVVASAPAPQQIALGEDPNWANRSIFRLEDELAQQPTSANQEEAMRILNRSPGSTVLGPIAYTSSGHPYELQPGESIFSGGRTIAHPDPAPVAPTPTSTPSPFNPIDLEGYLKAAQTLSASKKPKQRSPFGAPRYVRQR